MVNDAISSWVNVETQCATYIQIVSDGPPPPSTLNLFAATFNPPPATSAKSALLFKSADEAPPAYDPLTDPVAKRWFSPATNEDRNWKFASFVLAQQDDTLLNAFKAPQLSLTCNRAQLSAASTQYILVASSIT